MINSRKYFGTDGIRGRVGDDKINPLFMVRLGWAVGKVLGKDPKDLVLIGRDTRASGEMLQAALQAGLMAAGMEIGLLGVLPTPAIAYLTRKMQAQVGIVISASHNPYQDNGIKLFSHQGKKLSDEIELAIEQQLDAELTTIATEQMKISQVIEDAPRQYIDFCLNTVPPSLTLKNLKIVLDCANGAAFEVAPKIFQQLGADVILIGTEPDGMNINVNCGSTAIDSLSQTVLNQKADLGIAFDGDADRVILVDHQGEVVDGDELLFIVASTAISQGLLNGGVVGTVMSNLGLEQALKQLNCPFVRTAVGDRYVLAELDKRQWLLGGESSGHIVNLGHTTTGDGIITALQVLYALAHFARPLAELKTGMHKFPQLLVNVPISKSIDLEADSMKAAIAAAEEQLAGKGRVLLRPSGTEPVIRVMVEAQDQSQAQKVLETLVIAVKELA